MAKDKKSFLLYADLIHMVNQLPNDKAGELFKHVLSYVNDEDPQTDDVLIKIAFEPIKQSLKRDLEKYERIVQRNHNNGLKGGRPKEPKKPSGLNGKPNEPKKADSDNGSVNEINKTNPRESYDYSQERVVLRSIYSLFESKHYDTDSKKQKWLDTIRLLHHVDKFSYSKIEDVIKFAKGDDFWSRNLLSINSLRKKTDDIMKIDNIIAKMPKTNNTTDNYTPDHSWKKDVRE